MMVAYACTRTHLGASRRTLLLTRVVGVRGHGAVAIVLGATRVRRAVDGVKAVGLVEHLQLVLVSRAASGVGEITRNQQG